MKHKSIKMEDNFLYISPCILYLALIKSMASVIKAIPNGKQGNKI